MISKATNIHPVFDRIVGREEKEQILNQKARVIWMTGLSGSGKTTIAIGLEKALQKRGFLTQILDGDNIRTGINKNLGFSEEDRTENIRRIAEVSKLFVNCGIITINCFVSPTLAIREQAKEIIGDDDFREIYVNASYEECEKRDVKGLYKKARNGEIKNFTGLDAPFEAPENAFLEIKTADISIEESVKCLVDAILSDIKQA
ncbi:adenylyl-sulfate kinase [Ancylomarina euxinus]|uniref:Adenylyl-sulfate kinase n=1 Tax=Ancylomarina euxinus TaxID=2283627 RepID=A0A425Y0C1_9BACT|nr:adenylyl-sulfate kinase [Ancylomarina euxinus]MCZ4695276.1 adenylyl-sulfate kinase [Ancylomarina euxinus]MUP15473.1 adenylyl-sulfate kinase [Ancylomarina euxinus]RRG21182.1 adenylyl-sulfate kinase [Ancylomarina euxinus]